MLSQVLTRKEQFVLLFFAASICLGSAVLYWVNSTSTAEPVNEFEPQAIVSSDTTPDVEPVPVRVVEQHVPVKAPVQVSVAGAVREPGLYRFEEGDRVQEAIDAARGTLESADLSDINLAAQLIDGTTLTVPGESADNSSGFPVIRRPLAPPPNPPQYTVSGWQSTGEIQAVVSHGTAPTSNNALDLNRATAAELETLPGIGPKLASEIVRFRGQQPFQTVDDLDQVSGIGPKRLEAIRGLVTVAR